MRAAHWAGVSVVIDSAWISSRMRSPSAAFEGLSRVRQHQLVYATLGDRMREEIHALSMTTLTPAQWATTRNT